MNSHRAPIPGQVPEPQFLHLCRDPQHSDPPPPQTSCSRRGSRTPAWAPPTHTRRPGGWGQTGLGPASLCLTPAGGLRLHHLTPLSRRALGPPALVTRPVCSLLPQAHPCTHSPKSTAPSPGHSGCAPPPPPTVAPAQPQPPGWEVPPVPLLPQPPPSRPNPSARPSTARQDHPHRPCRPSQLPEGPALLSRPLGTLTLTAASAEPELTPHDPARTPPPPGSPPAPPQLHTAAQRPVPSTVPGNRVCSSSSLPAARVAPAWACSGPRGSAGGPKAPSTRALASWALLLCSCLSIRKMGRTTTCTT